MKGAQFTLEELTHTTTSAKNVFAGVFYLSPADYHSFHAPAAFSVERAEYVHGDCWPVNDTFMPKIGGLLAKNERVVLSGSYEFEGKRYRMWYVPVAALNVGGIKLGRLDLEKKTSVLTNGLGYVAGAKIGHFEFGSTVVLAFEVPEGRRVRVAKEGPVRVGEAVFALE